MGFRLQGPLRRALLVLAGTLAQTALPLFGTVGYEGSLIAAPGFAALAIAAGVDAVQRARSGPGPTVAGLARTGAATLAGWIALHLAVLWIAPLWQPACDRLSGLPFVALGPLAAGVVGYTCGVWAGALTGTRARGLMVGATIMAASIGLRLWRLYADPVVFAYDPFVGWFAGAIYDEDVAIGPVYLTVRAIHGLAVSGAWVLLALALDRQTGRWHLRRLGLPHGPALAFALACVAPGGLLLAAPERFGAHATVASLVRALPGERRTPHFVIHFDPRSPGAAQIDALAAEHEFAWARLERLLGAAPPVPVHSFVFANPAQKRALMGAGTVQVAAPWRGHIYLDERPFPHDVLHHELAHVFGATWGDPLFGISRRGLRLNLGLIEGFATALAPRPYAELDLHDQAAALDRLELRPPLAQVMGPGFWALAGRRAYTAAGSFCLWLAERYGMAALTGIYANAGDVAAVVGSDLATLEAQWLEFLRARPLADERVAAVAQRFARPPVFERPCAHQIEAIADKLVEARARGAWDAAIAAAQRLCRLEPRVAQHALALAQLQALAGDDAAARDSLAGALTRPGLTDALIAAIAEARADLGLRAIAEAAAPAAADVAAMDAAYAEALARGLEADRRRVLQLKRLAATDTALARPIREYFGVLRPSVGPVADAVQRLAWAQAIAQTRPALGAYLTALQLDQAAAPALARTAWDAAVAASDELPSEEFARAAWLGALSARFRAGDLPGARAALAHLREHHAASSGDRLDLELWHERIDHADARARGDGVPLSASGASPSANGATTPSSPP